MAVSVHRIILIKDDISSLEANYAIKINITQIFPKITLDWTFNWIDFLGY